MSGGSKYRPDPSLLDGSKFHDNIAQIYIRTTEDKLRNYLRDFKDSYATKYGWTVPLGVALSFGSTLLTATFTDKYNQTKAFWEAFFALSFIVSIIWFIIAVVRAFNCRKFSKIDYLIKLIKNDI